MTTRDLATLAKEMRVAQARYFKERTPEALEESKRKERYFDSVVTDILQGPDLFTEDTRAR